MGVLPEHNLTLNSSTDLLSEASGGAVTETEIATHGAIEGKSVGDSVWGLPQTPTYREEH